MVFAPLDDAKISTLSTRLLKRELPNVGFRKAVARSDVDFDGAPIIRVEAIFDGVSKLDARKLSSLMSALHDELSKKGDDRLVFLNNRYLGEEINDEEDADDLTGENRQ